MNEPEHDMQVALFKKLNELAETDKRFKYIYAIPNGGARNPIVGGKLKAEGVKKGVLDISWPLRMGKYVGLFMELKCNRNTPTKEQVEWAQWLTSQGWLVMLVRDDPDLAFEQFVKYANGEMK